MVTSGQIRTFQSATSAELGQAQSLIMRGRTHAARGDYRLERIIAVIQYLRNVGRDKAVREAISKAEEAAGQTLGFEAREEIAERFIPPPPPAPTQTLIPEPPRETRSIIGLPTIKERVEGEFARRGLKSPTESIPELAEDVVRTFTPISTFDLARATPPVTQIKVPSVYDIGGTQITRPPSFMDVDTGKLPPRQNLEIKTQQIIMDFNRGVITEKQATRQLDKAEKRFNLEESQRTLLTTFGEMAAVRAISVIAPPIGVMIGGAFVTSAVLNRREILQFAKTNPKAAAIQMAASIAGGMAGGRALRGFKAPKLDLPKVTLSGKGRSKNIREMVTVLEPNFEALQKSGRVTGTRSYNIEIPTPTGKTILQILEFEKDGIRQIYGREITRGTTAALFTGTILETGKNGLNRLITRIVTERNRGRYSNLEIQTFVEKAVVKSSKVKELRRTTLTENEVKLVKQFNLKGLTPEQVRAVLRKPLFSEAEIARRKDMAFTDAEFKAAKQLTKSEIVLGERITRIKFSRTDSLSGEITSSKGILDLRTLEIGGGFIKKSTPIIEKLTQIKVKITKQGEIKPVGKIPFKGKVKLIGEPTVPIKITKIPPPKRTPLSVTFGKKIVKPSQKLQFKQLEKLGTEVKQFIIMGKKELKVLKKILLKEKKLQLKQLQLKQRVQQKLQLKQLETGVKQLFKFKKKPITTAVFLAVAKKIQTRKIKEAKGKTS